MNRVRWLPSLQGLFSRAAFLPGAGPLCSEWRQSADGSVGRERPAVESRQYRTRWSRRRRRPTWHWIRS
ncbi:hypothetical protein EVA_09235 [gut metagenome]|uniref:Uncharacterized protein n=1 Tax=gut metagenome TaxID=749906 RepID=J9GRC0_9ZZZZ